MDQMINPEVYIKVNPWISHWALALVKKWEIARGKEKILDLGGNRTHDHRIGRDESNSWMIMVVIATTGCEGYGECCAASTKVTNDGSEK